MIIASLRASLHAKPMEWLTTGFLLVWAYTLLTGDTFEGPSYRELARVAGQEVWGWACALGGTARLVILWINGAWRKSPHLRSAAAFLSCFFWFLLALGFAMAGTHSTGTGMYALILVADAFNSARASREAGYVDTSTGTREKADGVPD